MKIKIINGLPIVSIKLEHQQKSIKLDNVLLDTGSAKTIFDTDIVRDIGITIDYINGKTVKMYGVGGLSEMCFQQNVDQINIEEIPLRNFQIQLGITNDTYGFDGIIGSDVLMELKLLIDYNQMKVYQNT